MKSLLGLLGFTTILPVGARADIEAFARRSWLYPVGGWVTGGIAALLVFPLGGAPVAAALALGLVFLLSGCHHFDGLLDLGDGLMAHGSREARVRALTDRSIGAGAAAMGITVTLIAFASLLSLGPGIWSAIIAAEVCSRLAMAYLTAGGRPFHEGLHSFLHARSRRWFVIPATALALPLFLLPASPVRIGSMIIASAGVAAALCLLSGRLFGGVNGDVVGAGGEITRAAVLIIAAL